jgi:predicted Zn-ribbon and HTH transcriptional regulator
MFRKELIPLLLDHPWSIADLARLLEVEQREVQDDLEHLLRSLKGGPYRIIIEPAQCRHCRFTFHREKLGKPGKCPRCKETWIQPPRVGLMTGP